MAVQPKDEMADMELKSVVSFEIKDADRGMVSALVSTMNVVDRDGDVILTGAIADGTTVKLSAYGHDIITKDKPPAGIGTISVKGDQAIMNGQYFLNTTRGRDAFETVKALGANSEWSIGFSRRVQTLPMTDEWAKKGARRLIAGINVIESSPVFRGANGLTGTLAVKQADGDPSAPVVAPTVVADPVDPPAVEAVPAEPVSDAAAVQAAADEAERQAQDAKASAIALETHQKFQRTMRSLGVS
jgi:hypothetical protein